MITGLFFAMLALALLAIVHATLLSEGAKMLEALRGRSPIAAEPPARDVTVSWQCSAPRGAAPPVRQRYAAAA